MEPDEIMTRFIGKSPALRQVQGALAAVASSCLTVLLLGETGTGKGLAARAAHALSPRRDRPFVAINCGTLPEGLVESELFGHERGAFTGAVRRKPGKVELAQGGTLFLDEIGDLPPDAQVKLLRLLEERVFERVGGTQTLVADVRVVAATHRDLGWMVREGRFRQDLFFRIHVFPVRLPPLRERREDIPLLVAHFLEAAASPDKRITGMTSAALARLKRYDWPGNVRELRSVVERAAICCPGETIRAEDLVLGPVPVGPDSARVTLAEHERRYIRQVLEDAGGIIRGAAAVLDIPESTLRWKMRKLGIALPRRR